MAKPAQEYRADHLSCPLNAGKMDQVRELVLALRKAAGLESKLQWQQFYQKGWAGFESMAKAGWKRPWVSDDTLSTSLAQMVMSQVAGSLKGYFGNVQNTYTEMVTGSLLQANIRHQLHFINRRQAWFWKCPIKVRQGVERIHPKTGKITLHEQDVIVSEEVRALARSLIRKALSMHRKPHFKRFQPQLDQRACWVQGSHTAEHPYWLQVATLKDQKRLSLPIQINQSFRERNDLSRLCQSLSQESPCPQIGDGQGFLTQMLAMEDVKNRNPYPSNLAVPNTVRLLLSEDQQSLTLGLVSDMNLAFEHQTVTYAPLCKAVCLDLGMCTFLATDDGELHGRSWMETLSKFDKLLTSIARHRQRLGLKVSSERYRFHVQRLRGFLKTEIHRILNRLIARKRPEKLVLEAVNFSSPHLSRRLNRLIQNFGQGVLTQKLTEIERQYGVTVEYRDSAYTSQQCNACGYVDKRNRTSQSEFKCKFCSKKVNADIQASRVLRDRRSVAVSFTSSRRTRQHLLVELVSQFNQRYTRPRGGPADPRFTNPYYFHWAQAQWKDPEEGRLAEVNVRPRRLAKKAA